MNSSNNNGLTIVTDAEWIAPLVADELDAAGTVPEEVVVLDAPETKGEDELSSCRTAYSDGVV